ncbi:kinase-like domain-containing protein, partial [Cyathus striatus]
HTTKKISADIHLGQTFGNHAQYQIRKKLGSGAFAVTYSAIHRSGGLEEKLYAVKVQPKAEVGTSQYEYILNEVRTLQRVKGHKNVVSYRDFVENQEYSFLVMELCTGHTLHSIICNGAFGERDDQTKLVFRQIVDGVRYLHNLNVYHLDLKSANIIVSPKWDVKIIDFGMASGDGESFDIFGTRDYMAPEILNCASTLYQWYSATADIWALGIILLVMITRSEPWFIADATKDIRYRDYVSRRDKNPHCLHRSYPLSKEISLVLWNILNPSYKSR